MIDQCSRFWNPKVSISYNASSSVKNPKGFPVTPGNTLLGTPLIYAATIAKYILMLNKYTNHKKPFDICTYCMQGNFDVRKI